MEGKLVSSWYDQHVSVPSAYVQPPERQPGNAVLVLDNKVPVIDLGGNDRDDIISNIIKASEEYGFFQVINHGVGKELMEEAVKKAKEFHGMEEEEKVRESSKDPKGVRCRLYTSSGRTVENVAHYWKDTLQLSCPPSGAFREYWPDNPVGYRQVFEKYTQEIHRLGLKILGMIGEGLGLKPQYFNGELSENPVLISHHYPPCPQPSLTLGTSSHRDPDILTILLQHTGITALQFFKHGAWIPVDPIPDAFVVNMGSMLQIISNGRLIGAEHRVITNSSIGRHTLAYFINPTKEALIEPAKPLITASSPPRYQSNVTFGELLTNVAIKGPNFEEQLAQLTGYI